MKVSINWIKFIDEKYGCAANPMPDGIDKLVEKIGAQLGAVEEVIDLGERYIGILIVKVVACEKHPNADKLSFCLVDDGGIDKKVKRNKDGLIEVVCGAPNVKAGMLAAWIPPGANVPSTYDKDPFVIETREIRGKISNGMLASPQELALGDSHEGLLVLEEGKPGDDFAKTLGLDDYVIDIENKMFTHRPDCFGMLGIARELAGIQGQVFKSPAWYREDAGLPTDRRKNVLKIQVKNDVPKLLPRFCAVTVADVKVAPSPAWLQVRLAAAGVKSINNIVDITNFYMLETGQPLHAYDYDKLKTGTLGARMSKKGDELKLLGGKTIKLEHEAVVITDGTKPIGLAGVMGGADTEVDSNTKNIVLEVANFDMNATRRAAMAYGLFTDAATRFTKGQSPRQNSAVIAKALEEIKRLAGGRQASDLIDDYPVKKTASKIILETLFINDRLGLDLSAKQIQRLLQNVEFKVTHTDKKPTTTQNNHFQGPALEIEAPFWRTDIEIPEDIVEEVGRLYGYDHLKLDLPQRDLTPAELNPGIVFKNRLRDIMTTAGANEVLTYSFVHGNLMKKAGQNPLEAYEIANALSPDLQYYRMSLLPSLLEKVNANKRNGYESFVLYEIGKAHVKGHLDEDKLPAEPESISGVVVDAYAQGAPYFAARNLVDYILFKLNIYGVTYQPLEDATIHKRMSFINTYEPSRTAAIWYDGKPIGMVGEPSRELRQSLKLPAGTSIFELDIIRLYNNETPPTYRPINRFPSSTQDICLKLPAIVTYSQADGFVWSEIQDLASKHGYNCGVQTQDIFQRKDDKDHKQITWRIELSHSERTLTTDEVNQMLDQLGAIAKIELNAERI